MTAPVLYRAYAPVETDDGDGLTVVGLAAPYDEVCAVDDGAGPYRELFERGAFTHVTSRWPARRLKVQLEHPERPGMGAWVGRGAEWRDGAEGLHVVLRLDDTPDGHAAAFKVRDGQTPAMSIGFIPGRSDPVWHEDLGAEVTHRRSVRAVNHVALVPEGAYRSALVEAIRRPPSTVDRGPYTVDGPDLAPTSLDLAELPPPPTPRRDELDQWLATMRGDSPPCGPPPG